MILVAVLGDDKKLPLLVAFGLIMRSLQKTIRAQFHVQLFTYSWKPSQAKPSNASGSGIYTRTSNNFKYLMEFNGLYSRGEN